MLVHFDKMKNISVQALCWIVFLTTTKSVGYDDCMNIVQLSKENQNTFSDVRRLHASIIPCQSPHQEKGVKCQPLILIKAWIDPKTDEQTFLIIDEIHDAKDRTSDQLMNPYLIQVSTGEPTSLYPLVLSQVLDVTCPEKESLRRRTADNGAILTKKGAKKISSLI
jgi:hypothetical protein